jgi:SAM-dependent methyltransferase
MSSAASGVLERVHRERHTDNYCDALDAGLPQKLRIIEPWVRTWSGAEIVDVGAGTSALAARLAQRSPDSAVIAVDAAAAMVARSQSRYGWIPNLVVRLGDAADAHSESASCVILCSVLHEVYSYAGDSLAAVRNAVAAASRSLLPGGTLIIRDFVTPVDAGLPVLFRQPHADIVPGNDFLSFASSFCREILVRGLHADAHGIVYETDALSACEYLLRKDYHEMWEAELHERYGFWTSEEAIGIVQAAGFSIVHTRLVHSAWQLQGGLRSRVDLTDRWSGRPLSSAPCQILLVAEKPLTARRTPIPWRIPGGSTCQFV